jgi:hypothetical protein
MKTICRVAFLYYRVAFLYIKATYWRWRADLAVRHLRREAAEIQERLDLLASIKKECKIRQARIDRLSQYVR